jgi:OOP family OmpA-OmpF porin
LETSFGDIRIVPRVSLLPAARRLQNALLAPMSLPTGKRENYAGEPFRVEPRIAVDYQFTRGAGFGDEDGCPESDYDGDGVLEAQDKCPTDPEDRDSYEDEDGCPEPDNDADGILDVSDACARDAEDRDGFEDSDGCPDLDNDGDGVPDAKDRCPAQAGPAAQDGCPADIKAVLTGDRIELREPVFFATGRATIEARSKALLDAIAEILKAHPEVTAVSVQGHTDATGSPVKNRTLSKQRAEAVVAALVTRGVDAKRLTAEGFGADRPVTAEDSAEARALNRRVELHVQKRAE